MQQTTATAEAKNFDHYLELVRRVKCACRAAVIFAVALWCWGSLGAEPGYYVRLQAFLSTNLDEWEVRSPLLVDTNNNQFKLTNAIVNLASMRKTGALAGVRPGLTMDEVVGLWGRPMELWAKGFGGPRLRYREVNVFFEPAGGKVKSVYTQDLPALLRKLGITPKIEECLAALGAPAYREDSATGAPGSPLPAAVQTTAEQELMKSAPIMWTFLVYDLPEGRLKVGCERGRLATLQLEAPE